MNRNLFRAALARAGQTQQGLAREMDMADSTMTRKIQQNTFTIDQAERLGEILGLSKQDLIDIFFVHEVT